MKFSIRRVNEWLILLMIFILVPVLYTYVQNNLNIIPDNFDYLYNFTNIHPTTVIMGLGVVDAIDLFGGGEPQGYSMSRYTVPIYFNVIIYLMIGPYLFFKGYKNAKGDPNKAKPWYWYIGGVICIGAALIVPVEISHMQKNENYEVGVAKNRTMYQMRNELAEVGFAAAQHEILKDKVNESFKIEDLNMDDLKYDHTVESIQSDTLLVISVSNPERPDLSFRMEVRPYSECVFCIRN